MWIAASHSGTAPIVSRGSDVGMAIVARLRAVS